MIVGLQQKFSGRTAYLMPMAVYLDLEEGCACSTSPRALVARLVALQAQPRIDEFWFEPDFSFTKRARVIKVRLGSFLTAQGIDEVDYRWIDAQGSDFRVLQSLSELIDAIKESKSEGGLLGRALTRGGE